MRPAFVVVLSGSLPRGSPLHRPVAALVLVLVLVAACASPGPSTPAAATLSPSPGASSEAARSASPSTTIAVWTSLRWAAPTLTAPFENLSDGAAWTGGYAAVGSFQNASGGIQAAAWWSPDWRTWTRTMLDVPASGSSSIGHVLPIRTGLVAVGVSGETKCVPPEGEGQICEPTPVAFWTTTDGRHWTAAAAPAGMAGLRVDAVASNGSLLVLAGDTGWNQPAIWATTDGATWRREALPAAFRDAHLAAVAAVGSGFVLTGSTGGAQPDCCATGKSDTTPAAWVSTDGMTWQPAIVEGSAAAVGDRIGPVFVGSAGMVAWGGRDNSYGWTSPDGRRWTAVTKPAGYPVIPKASDGTRIVGDSYATRDQEVFWVSSDGVTWQALAAIGATDQMPAWSGPGVATADAEFLFADGLGLVGQNGTTQSPLWFAQAQTGP